VAAGLLVTDAADADDARAARVPVGRLGEPADVGDAVVFLASPASAYVSGANLVLHGGGERPAYLDAFTGG
jgi:NAD(P)-dependent dehydrogenase (short-subunit alcohol dehydrogenase family)